MLDTFGKVFIALLLTSVAVVLVKGLWNFTKGGDSSTSQAMMRMRIMLQAIAIIGIMGFLWLTGRGP